MWVWMQCLSAWRRHTLVGHPGPEAGVVRLVGDNLDQSEASIAASSRPIRAHLDPAVRQLDLVLALGQLARCVLHVAVVVACQHKGPF